MVGSAGGWGGAGPHAGRTRRGSPGRERGTEKAGGPPVGVGRGGPESPPSPGWRGEGRGARRGNAERPAAGPAALLGRPTTPPPLPTYLSSRVPTSPNPSRGPSDGRGDVGTVGSSETVPTSPTRPASSMRFSNRRCGD